MMFFVSPKIDNDDLYSMYNMDTSDSNISTNEMQERINTLEQSMEGITVAEQLTSVGGNSGTDSSTVQVNTSVSAIWELIQKWAKDRGQDPLFIASVVAQESNFNPNAHNSSSDATGLMQVTPICLSELRNQKIVPNSYTMKSLYDPSIAIEAGTGYFKWISDNYAYGDYRLMCIGYNPGIGYISKYKQSGDSALKAGEARNYHNQVMSRYEAYQTGAKKVGQK